MIDKIGVSVNTIKYTLIVDNSAADIEESISQSELSLSKSVFLDETEELFARIHELEGIIRQRDEELLVKSSELERQRDIWHLSGLMRIKGYLAQ